MQKNENIYCKGSSNFLGEKNVMVVTVIVQTRVNENFVAESTIKLESTNKNEKLSKNKLKSFFFKVPFSQFWFLKYIHSKIVIVILIVNLFKSLASDKFHGSGRVHRVMIS